MPKRGIKVKFVKKQFGIEAYPISKKFRDKVNDYLDTIRDICDGQTATVFFQGHHDLPDEMKNHKYVEDLLAGWSVTIVVDPYTYLTWVGYDAANSM